MNKATCPSLDGLVVMAREGAVGHRDPVVNDAAVLISTAAGQLTLAVSRRSSSIGFRGWSSPAGTVLASEPGGAGTLKLAVLVAPELPARIARLVDLGPRRDSDQELQLLVPGRAFEALLAGTPGDGSDTIGRALGLPDDGLAWAVEALAAEDLTHWRLDVEALGEIAEQLPPAEIDVLDSLARLCGCDSARRSLRRSCSPRRPHGRLGRAVHDPAVLGRAVGRRRDGVAGVRA